MKALAVVLLDALPGAGAVTRSQLLTERTRRKPQDLWPWRSRRVSQCGFSQVEDAIESIERMCYNAGNVGFGCTVTRFGGST